MRTAFALVALGMMACVPKLPDFPECDDTLGYVDADNDGFGAGELVSGCDVDERVVPDDGDCNDEDAAVSPDAEEICNGVDDDCDEQIDEGVATMVYPDADNDQYGEGEGVLSCDGVGAGQVAVGGDCNGADPGVHPGVLDVCNGADDDCDGSFDEDGSASFAWLPDGDGDGYGDASASPIIACAAPVGNYVTQTGDCDDAEFGVNPGATDDTCNGVDENCDTVDNEANATFYWPDVDNDGYGDEFGAAVEFCAVRAGYVANDQDCDDSTPLANPAAAEACDGFDNDCNSQVDEGFPVADFYVDADGDGFGTGAAMSLCAALGEGFAAVGGDCDDVLASVNPGATEVCDAVDNDCDVATPEPTVALWPDADSDGFGDMSLEFQGCTGAPKTVLAGGDDDCDDANMDTYPFADEACDGEDNDCDGQTDEDQVDVLYYADADGDGYGAAGSTGILDCKPPIAGYVRNERDCDDGDASISPAETDTCDGFDTNCDGTVDSDATFVDYYVDADGDGAGERDSAAVSSCSGPPVGFPATTATDCNDDDNTIRPGKPELCDGIDQDCDGVPDDGLATVDYWLDGDGDGFGQSGTKAGAVCPAIRPSGTSLNDDDCDDEASTTFPGAPELCNQVDDDCDEVADDGLNGGTWFVDSDGDGFGVGLVTSGVYLCGLTQPNFAQVRGDCDDANQDAYPGATEVCDGLDDNCDTFVDNVASGAPGTVVGYVDGDNDGYGVGAAAQVCPSRLGVSHAAQAGDCLDSNAAVNPGATEVVSAEDLNCDGCVVPVSLNVPADFAQPSAAVAAACDDGFVNIAAGDYVGGFTVSRNVTVRGAAGGLTTLSSTGTTPLIDLVSGTVHDLVFEHGVQVALRISGAASAYDLEINGVPGGGRAVVFTQTATGAELLDTVITDSGCGAAGPGVVFIDRADDVTLINVEFDGTSCVKGGAIAISGADGVSLQDILATGVSASESGGVLYVKDATDLLLIGLLAGDVQGERGAVFYVENSSTVVLSDVVAETVQATSGGLLYAMSADVSMDLVVGTSFEAVSGTAFVAQNSVVSLADSSIYGLRFQNGGAIYGRGAASDVSVLDSRFSRVYEPVTGAIGCAVADLQGIAAFQADGFEVYSVRSQRGLCATDVGSVDISRSVFGDFDGSALEVLLGATGTADAATFSMTYSTLAKIGASGVQVSADIMAQTMDHALFTDMVSPVFISVPGSNLIPTTPAGVGNVRYNAGATVDWPATMVMATGNPLFVGYGIYLPTTAWDLHLRSGSSAKDIGPVGCLESNGTLCDAGAYGGPATDATWYVDGDFDGMPDGWELYWGGGNLAAAADLDGDGLSNASEYIAGTRPDEVDSDTDGVSDFADPAPTNWKIQ